MAIKVSALTELPSPIVATDTIYVVRGAVSYKATGVNIPFAQPKIYKAFAVHPSALVAPVSTIFVNTLGGTPVWSRTSTGIYDLILVNTFFPGKLYIPFMSDWVTGDNTPMMPIVDYNTGIVGYYSFAYGGATSRLTLVVRDLLFLPVDLFTLIGTNRLSLPTVEIYP